MTPLESKFSALIADCENIMEPSIITAIKWHRINPSQKQTINVIDEKTSLSISYSRSSEKIQALASYKAAKKAFERDKIFCYADKKAGHWGTFEGVLQYIISATCKITRKRIIFHPVNAISELKELRQLFTRKHISYIATTKLFGATTTSKKVTLPDEVEIIRLNIEEQNKREPIIQPYQIFGANEFGSPDSQLELSLPITIPIDDSKENSFFTAQNDAQQAANEIFKNILDAILVSHSGRASIGQTKLHGGLKQIMTGQRLIQEHPPHVNITIKKHNIDRIHTAYDLISEGKKGDKPLSRALHRFILGRKRPDLIDKLVDYVISWEAILLTQEGSPIPQELSYRFSLNGASLLSASNRKLDKFDNIKQLKTAYALRSTIVHGGGDAEINKKLRDGGFNDLQSLCDYLESCFRETLFWLSQIDTKDRPYKKRNGWEELIWSSH